MRWAALMIAPLSACLFLACQLEVTMIGALGDASSEDRGDAGIFFDTGRPPDAFSDAGGFSDGTVTDVGWSVAAKPPDVVHLRGLWLASPTEPWILGEGVGVLEDATVPPDAASEAGGVLIRLSGTSWASLPVPRGNALWGASPDQVWMVGTNSLASSDGGSFTSTSPPDASVNLTTVWGSDANHVWAAGTAMLFYDGGSWRVDDSFPTDHEVHALGGTSATDVWAVGEAGSIHHWVGSVWEDVSIDPSTTLRAVWSADATDAWIVGDRGTILRWNGKTWAPQPSGTLIDLLGVSGTSNTDVWIVGKASAGESTVIHWNGTSLSPQPGLKPPVDLTAVASGNYNSAWAIGDSVILRFLR